MNRRDTTMLIMLILWALFIFFGLEHVARTAHEMIVCFNVSIMILILSCLMLTIGSLGRWGDKKLFNRKTRRDEER